MKTLTIGLPTSLGELINIKYHLDLVKHSYGQIKLSFQKSLWNEALHTEAADWSHKRALWDKYLDDIGRLFFAENPYFLTPNTRYPLQNFETLVNQGIFRPQKAEMAHLLCYGTPLDLKEEYIVITTKVREVPRQTFFPLSIQLWAVIKKLSVKYKIVILGEREVEMRKEYNAIKHSVFGLYEQIISNIDPDRILDLTVPALGETVADLKEIQQDCLIMRDAKLVITLGVGGNFCMASSVAKMVVGFRQDGYFTPDIIFARDYHNAVVSKDWGKFINTLERFVE